MRARNPTSHTFQAWLWCTLRYFSLDLCTFLRTEGEVGLALKLPVWKGRGEKASEQVNSKKSHPHTAPSLSRYFWAKPLFKLYSTASPSQKLYKKNNSCLPSLSGEAHLRALVTVQLNFTFCAGSPLNFLTSLHLCNLCTVDLIPNIACSRLCNNLMSMFTGTACTLYHFLFRACDWATEKDGHYSAFWWLLHTPWADHCILFLQQAIIPREII